MLEGLGKASCRYGVRIHGYCLMPNHFHLLIQQQEQPVDLAMRSLSTRYAREFNKKYGKVGHVFQGRYRGILCDKAAYLLELLRYIHLNPVRVRSVEKAHEWPWSSLAVYLGKSKNDWLYQDDVLQLFGQQPRRRLLEFLSQAPDLTSEQVYPAESLSILGCREYVQQAIRQREPRRARQRVYTGRKLALSRLREILCGAAGTDLEQLCRRHKGSKAQSAVRESLAHVAIRIMFYREAEVARFLQISSASVNAALHRYDVKLRQDPHRADELVHLLMENI